MSAAEVSRRAVVGGVLLAGALAATPLQARRFAPFAVDCSAGRITGRLDDEKLGSFLGIRYGTAERFRAPAPFGQRGAIRRVGDFGPASPQRGRYDPQSEDCLFLNIWTKAPTVPAKKPVMVYFHGGAYTTGSVTDPLNDGAALAARGDVVVVTVNHRLNAFGYLYLAELDPRFPDSGNAGQLDLILALEWVRDNIAAFGGNPGCVTVFGQSGGGAKIATLMAMPAARGLFHRAITMSGQQVTASGPRHATERTRTYLAKLGVSERDLSPLLTMPVEQLVLALGATDPILGGSLYFGPVLDMRALARHPFWPDAPAQSARIPMLLGNTRDETRAFYAATSDKVRDLSWDNVGARIAAEVPSDILPSYVVAQYRRREPGWSPREIFYAATTAGRSWRGQVIEAEARARAGSPTWVYQLDFASRTDPDMGAHHTLDIPLAFGTLGAEGSRTGTDPAARAASAALQDSFVRFAKTGEPGWPRYDLTRRATMIFDTRSQVIPDPRGWQRELFARVPYIQPGT
ncbi:MAG: carboxylesterase family protein [Pseudomonadota bacterium]